MKKLFDRNAIAANLATFQQGAADWAQARGLPARPIASTPSKSDAAGGWERMRGLPFVVISHSHKVWMPTLAITCRQLKHCYAQPERGSRIGRRARFASIMHSMQPPCMRPTNPPCSNARQPHAPSPHSSLPLLQAPGASSSGGAGLTESEAHELRKQLVELKVKNNILKQDLEVRIALVQMSNELGSNDLGNSCGTPLRPLTLKWGGDYTTWVQMTW